jgi:hypothetical protein
LQKIWIKSPEKVTNAFEFIGKTQARMWKDLSDVVFSYNGNMLQRKYVTTEICELYKPRGDRSIKDFCLYDSNKGSE